jgi:hypothetical protein
VILEQISLLQMTLMQIVALLQSTILTPAGECFVVMS